MSAAAEARSLFVEIAGPIAGSAWVTNAVNAVAEATGLPHRRLRGIWAREARRIDAEEMDALRAARDARKAGAAANVEFTDLAARLALVESRLAKIDPAFFGEEIHRLGNVTNRIRGLAR